MDFQRPASKRTKWLKRFALLVAIVASLGTFNYLASHLGNDLPTIDSRSVVIAEVQHGELVHQVRGVGHLEAEKVLWIPAQTEGRIAEIFTLPGTDVTRNTPIVRMTNPDLQLALEEAHSAVASSKAELRSQRAILNNQALKLESELVRLKAEHQEAEAIYDVAKILLGKNAEPEHNVRLKEIRVHGLKLQHDVSEKSLNGFNASRADQLAVFEEKVVQAQAKLGREQSKVDSLLVKAGFDGVLARLPVEVGQQIAAGEPLARVVNPKQLKAVLKVPEVQARHIQMGQNATVDTHRGFVAGHVTRIDPEVTDGSIAIDIAFDAPLPDEARPDLSVLGLVEVRRLDDVLSVARPASGMAESNIEIFRMEADSILAVRVAVQTGIASVNSIEIRRGLNEHDRVIVSDMSRFDGVDRIRVE